MLVVGKKYVQDFGYTKGVQTCTVLWANKLGALVQWDISGGIVWFNNVQQFREYVPPPVKKEGWIVMFRCRNDGSIHIPTSRPKETSELARQEFAHYFEIDRYGIDAWTTKIEWTEPAPSESDEI